MAQSPGYDHDIFISYAHNDNYGFGGGSGWVDVFEDWLYNWLHNIPHQNWPAEFQGTSGFPMNDADSDLMMFYGMADCR